MQVKKNAPERGAVTDCRKQRVIGMSVNGQFMTLEEALERALILREIRDQAAVTELKISACLQQLFDTPTATPKGLTRC